VIYGVGIDEVEVARVEKKLEETAGLKERLFTGTEIKYCESKKNKAQHFAARFAAKEAFFKALGTGWRKGMGFSEIEIVDDDLGKPACVLHGKVRQYVEELGINGYHISLTHLKDIAAAIVVLEKS
jgi:holo-[acyl-carrier protein] synthase